jgi:hypothetical protein
LILEGDDGDTLAGGVYEWKCGKMLDHGGLGNLNVDKSGHLESEVLLLQSYVLIRAGVVTDVDTYT